MTQEGNEINGRNFSIPTNNDDDEEITLLIKQRIIYSSNNRETSFRSLPLSPIKEVETNWDWFYRVVNTTTIHLCRCLEQILDIISVPRKLGFVFILSLTLYGLKNNENFTEHIGNPYSGKVATYYRPETTSSQSILSHLEDGEGQGLAHGIDRLFSSKESSAPIPDSFKNIADVSDLPVKKEDVPFYFHIPRAGGSTIKDVLGSCLGLVGSTGVGSRGKNVPNTTKLEVVTGKGGSRFVNVDTSTLEGIKNAKELQLIESGLVDYVVTQHLHAAAELFTENQPGRMFTIMRDPIERAVSLFHYLAIAHWEPTYNPSLKTMTIEMWAQSKDRIENNWVTRFLSNNWTANVTQHDLAVAKEILTKKCLIGFLEAKEESMLRFQKYFGWDMSDSKTRDCAERFLQWGWSNKNSHPPIEVDSYAYKLLVKSNEYDMELYEYAKLLFEIQAEIF